MEGSNFIQLPKNTTSSSYLIIDDLGALRFIGTGQTNGLNAAGSNFEETVFNNNSQPNQYISVLTSFQTIGQQYSNPITNANNWIFFFTNSELVISRANIVRNFKLPTAFFSLSGIFDSVN